MSWFGGGALTLGGTGDYAVATETTQQWHLATENPDEDADLYEREERQVRRALVPSTAHRLRGGARALSFSCSLSRSLARSHVRALFLSLSLSLRLSLSSQSCLLACSRPRALFLCARVCVSVCILSIWCAPDATRAAPPTVVCASGRVSPHLGQDRKEDGRDGGHAGAGA